MATQNRKQRGSAAYKRGLWAEWLAVWFLRVKLYQILGQRVRTAAGEVDIVARKGDLLIIVEVKARGSYEDVVEAVQSKQKIRLVRSAEILHAQFSEAEKDLGVRFDVIQIVPGRWLIHLRDAWRP